MTNKALQGLIWRKLVSINKYPQSKPKEPTKPVCTTKKLFQNRRRWNTSSAISTGFQPPGRQYNYRPQQVLKQPLSLTANILVSYSSSTQGGEFSDAHVRISPFIYL
jgi:hypothetical protein